MEGDNKMQRRKERKKNSQRASDSKTAGVRERLKEESIKPNANVEHLKLVIITLFLKKVREL